MSLLHSRFMRLARGTLAAWIEDNCPSRAAVLAYYTTFSLAPILVIATAIATAFFKQDAVVGAIVEEAQKLVGEEGAALVHRLLLAAGDEENRGVAALLGIAALLIGATTAFAELKDSLDAIWRAPPTEPKGIRALVHARLLSFALVLLIGVLLVVFLIANAALDAFSAALSKRIGLELTLGVRLIGGVVSIAGVAILFTLIFKLLPAVRPSWRTAWRGAAVTTVLFLIGRAGIGIYLGNTATASSFGAAGALAVLLLWIYYSAMMFFVGAEYTRVHSTMQANESPRRDAPVSPPRKLATNDAS